MKSTLQEIIKSIPDFDEFLRLTDEIGDLSLKKMLTEREIRRLEANAVREAFSNPQFYVGGKPASMSYIDSTYKFEGLAGEILPLREQLADLTSVLDKRKLQLSVYKDMLEVFRTISANERSTSI